MINSCYRYGNLFSGWFYKYSVNIFLALRLWFDSSEIIGTKFTQTFVIKKGEHKEEDKVLHASLINGMAICNLALATSVEARAYSSRPQHHNTKETT